MFTNFTVKTSLIFLFILYTFNFFGQEKSEAIKKYDLGVNYFREGKFREADSLFSLSLQLEPNMDAFFNKAVVNKKQGDLIGYCTNLELASRYGDKEATKLFSSDCKIVDSFFVTEDYKKANIENYFYKIKITKYKYVMHQEFFRYDKKNQLDLSYEVIDADTAYIMLPKVNMDNIITTVMEPIYKTIRSQIKYPQKEKEAGISGTVYLQFYINKLGIVENIKVLRTPTYGLAEEALRIIKFLPHFKPHIYEGNAVRIKLILPVKFTLK